MGAGAPVSIMSTRALTIAGFAVVIVAMFVLEFLARRPGSRIPTLGQWLGYLMRPRIGRVLIARGRDAADVAISSTFGPNTLLNFKVWTDEISSVGTP